MKKSYVMANANVLFCNETFPHIAKSNKCLFVCCLNHGEKISLQGVFCVKNVERYKIISFLPAFIFFIQSGCKLLRALFTFCCVAMNLV